MLLAAADLSSTRALTEALLLYDFNIHAEPPSDRLCAAVPNRTNYVLWLQDLLANTWVPGRGSEPHQSMVPLSLDARTQNHSEERPSKRARTEKAAGVPIEEKQRQGVRVLDM